MRSTTESCTACQGTGHRIRRETSGITCRTCAGRGTTRTTPPARETTHFDPRVAWHRTQAQWGQSLDVDRGTPHTRARTAARWYYGEAKLLRPDGAVVRYWVEDDGTLHQRTYAARDVMLTNSAPEGV